MDLTPTIRQLYAEKNRLDRAIAALELLASPEPDGEVARGKGRRGRPPARSKEQAQASGAVEKPVGAR
jgi:hypothetical protein